ncbi:phenylalanyl-tRNA synthetase, mitochondrial precursor [Aspergillus terreus NIH2624]|uniref:Phenylalanyl-tRNA synthetase, mitochondrial n=1 Tax=Aspergillus terreus (strain NIH 2624 / FGSC A1156) TaxID=341663 RepID=Q0CYG4_ASPTN|nr:phenylalanyl-tRNA synthetase, mitochondrial precursor [Aspergillus terreus NIH2624]EAU38027.1 phenylalanyl-tRNA synthetase, mitochondrial precursor [Aspergillus terreus NIH2624]
MAMRSRPMPNAHPMRCGTSELISSSCLMTPHPSTSSQSPCQNTSSSHEGLVKGNGVRGAGGGGGGLAPLGEDLDDHALERALEVRRDGLDLLVAVVRALQRVAVRVDGGVGVVDGDVVGGDFGDVATNGGGGGGGVGEWVGLRTLPQHGALHLVEDGVVAAVDGVAAVDVGDDGVADLVRAGRLVAVELLEVGLLVGAGVGAQDGLVVDVVGVGAAAARVVGREAQHVKVVRRRDDRVRLGVVAVDRAWERALDQLARDGERVVLLQVETASDVREDGVRRVGPVVRAVGFAFDGQGGLCVRACSAGLCFVAMVVLRPPDGG